MHIHYLDRRNSELGFQKEDLVPRDEFLKGRRGLRKQKGAKEEGEDAGLGRGLGNSGRS